MLGGNGNESNDFDNAHMMVLHAFRPEMKIHGLFGTNPWDVC